MATESMVCLLVFFFFSFFKHTSPVFLSLTLIFARWKAAIDFSLTVVIELQGQCIGRTCSFGP